MKTERVFFILFIIILIMRFGLMISYTSVLLVLTLTALIFVFFPGGIFFFIDKEFKQQKIWLSLLIGLLLSFAPIVIMAKLLYWAESEEIIKFSLLIGVISTVLTGILYKRADLHNTLKTYYRNMVIRSIVVTSILFLVTLTPTTTLINVQFRYDPELVRLKLQVHNHPDSQAAWDELERYNEKPL